mgnify:CR=1 FL=1
MNGKKVRVGACLYACDMNIMVRLSKLGVQFPTGEPTTFSFGIRNFYVADPEGNLLEIGSTSET